jgi:hypothetical protein
MGFFDILLAGDQTDSRRQAQDNNAAGLAFSVHKLTSKGQGINRLPDPIMFSVIFIEEPHFVQGASLITRPALAVGEPLGSAGVWQWHRNPKGYFTGAYVYLSVALSEVEYGDDGVQMTHNLMFTGIGYKDLGQAVSTEAQLLTPRAVGFGV